MSAPRSGTPGPHWLKRRIDPQNSHLAWYRKLGKTVVQGPNIHPGPVSGGRVTQARCWGRRYNRMANTLRLKHGPRNGCSI